MGDRFYLIFAVEDLARAAAGAGRIEPAARLFGAAAALRLSSGALLPPGGLADHDRDLSSLRAGLGDRRFEEAWSEGGRRSLDALVADALNQRLQPRAADAPVDARLDARLDAQKEALTARELQVVRLLGSGGSNQQIAAELAITVGTARIHVEHILAKLNMHSRHQVADWARANGLATGS